MFKFWKRRSRFSPASSPAEKHWWQRWYWYALAAVLLLIGATVLGGEISDEYALWDRDKDRGADMVNKDASGTVTPDAFGDVYTEVKYLEQNWKPQESLWFYNTTQGSDLMPYDFFMVLDQPGTMQLFRSNENMNNRYRYLARKKTFANPDALPVGFVKDTYRGQEFIGLTCAACHTGQLNYKGTAYRIDGGSGMADMENFIGDLSGALNCTQTDCQPGIRDRFVKDVLARGNYGSAKDVLDDLSKWNRRIAMYYIVNEPTLNDAKADAPETKNNRAHYGYARLDAFGRIFNKVLEYLVDSATLQQALGELAGEGKIKQDEYDKIIDSPDVKRVLSGADRDHIVENIAKVLTREQQLQLRDKLFIRANAPVSYPFLWDTSQHDYVQWNGIAANAQLGAIGRNTGEVIGVFGTMNWHLGDHWTIGSVLSGQGFTNHPAIFESSVNVHNLALLEDRLKKLQSPIWPKEFGDIDKDDAERSKVKHGRILFEAKCARCHAHIDRADPERRVVAFMSGLDKVKTDPAMAENSVSREGYSGVLRNRYVDVGFGTMLIGQKAPLAALLTEATLGVVATPDSDKWFGQRLFDWTYDVIFALRNNRIQPSLKTGQYDPDTSAKPVSSLRAYKARPLNGIWATAPYLHNGSVPSLYDLLLPKKRTGDPDTAEYRPDIFQVGSREFDPVKVGYKTEGYQGFTFDTSIQGNWNVGHDYGARDVTLDDGTILKALTTDERWDLVEYLKTL